MRFCNRICDWIPCLLGTLLAVTAGGCGGAGDDTRASVDGTVTVDGTLAEQGTICFVPTEGTQGPASYGVITNGKYALSAGDRGPVVGKHKVQIEAFRDLGKKSLEGQPIKDQIVPAEYNAQSKLVVEIVKGWNIHDFKINTK